MKVCIIRIIERHSNHGDANMNMMQVMMQFREATTAAQIRTGDKSISTDVKKGKVRVSSVTFDKKGKATIKAFTEYLEINDALTYINGMGA